MKRTQRFLTLLLLCLLAVSPVFAAALVPAVNSTMLNMAGGTPPSTIWVPTATQAIGTGDTSCFSATGQGPGQTITPTTSPVAPYVGNAFQLSCSGVFTTGLTTATITTKIKWGSTTVASATSANLTISLTNAQWTAQATCVVIAISATPSASTVMCSGNFTYAAVTSGSNPVVTTNFQSTSPVSVDTTAAFKPDLTLSLSSTSSGQSATSLMGADQIVF